MALGTLRLVLVGFWLLIGLAVFFRNDLAPGGLADRLAGGHGPLVGMLAVGLALWNLVRWYAGRTPPAEEPVLVRREVTERPFEYNPELDFTRDESASERTDRRE